MADTKIILRLNRVLRACALWPALAVFGIFLAMGGPARADITDVMHEIQRSGSARVVITMRTGTAGQRAWMMGQSTDLQQAAVAAATPAFERRMQAANIPLIRRYKTLPFAAAIVNADQALSLASMPEVAAVHLVRIQHKLPTPVISSESSSAGIAHQQATLSTSLQTTVASIDVPNAWAAGYTGQGWTVAVLDGGFNITHPMLSGKNVGDACFANDDFGTPECPSGQTPQIGPGAASNCKLEADGVTNRCDHGSNVASIAVGNDGTNFGVAKSAKFMPIDIFSADSTPSDCNPDPGYTPCEVTDDMAQLDALDYVNQNAATYNIAAVNMSLGGEPQTSACDSAELQTVAIQNLRNKGIAVMIAAGNDGLIGQVEEPGCISIAETVGATDASTNVASFSNFATMVDLMAPGELSENVRGNVIGITAAAGTGSRMISLYGTSMATPHVAGAWAVMRSAYPTATANQLEQALKSTGISVTESGAGFSVPKIQVMHAINFVANQGRTLFNQIISSNASSLGLSYLRVYNAASTAGTVTFTIADTVSGTSLGTWTSPSIPGGASTQFAMSDIEKNAMAQQGQTITATGRNYYNLNAVPTFNGYVQYLLVNTTLGVVGNMTSCSGGPSADGTTVLYVTAANNAGYASHIRVVNTGAVAGPASLSFFNSATGQQVAQWTSPSIAPGATYDATESQIEAATPALSGATSGGAYAYNVVLANFAGYLQYVAANSQTGLLTDLSEKCSLTASSS